MFKSANVLAWNETDVIKGTAKTLELCQRLGELPGCGKCTHEERTRSFFERVLAKVRTQDRDRTARVIEGE